MSTGCSANGRSRGLIKSVNIGGMAFKTGKTQITKAVSVDESDIAAFKKLHEMGIELEIRPVATDKK